LALLMRKPDDRRCIAVASELWEVPKLRCALSDCKLVWTLVTMTRSFLVFQKSAFLPEPAPAFSATPLANPPGAAGFVDGSIFEPQADE